MQPRHPQRRQLVQSWQLYIQQHAAVFAAIRAAILVLIALLGVVLFQSRALWTKQSASTELWLDKQSGQTFLLAFSWSCFLGTWSSSSIALPLMLM